MRLDRRIAVTFSTAFLTIILDRAAKFAACKNLAAGQSAGVIPGIFRFTLVLNKGAAFGILKDQKFFFILLSIAAIIFIISYVWKKETADMHVLVSLGLILGGVSGNLIDRVKLGYVIDFLDLRIWPVFNVADSAITVGAILLGWTILTRKPKPKI